MVQSFDGLDRVTRVERTDALGSSDPGVVLREYYAGGQVHRQTNGLGVTTTIVLDGMNRVIETNATVNGETLTTAAVYDGNSNVLSSTDRRGVATLNTYDALNRLTELEVGGQTVATMEYDALGNKLAETDLQGNRTAFAHDDLYRVSARTLPTGHVEGFTYDRVGNKLAESDANGHVTTFQYDRLNRLVRRLDAESNEVTFAYDEAGNAVQEKDITRGLDKIMAYDALNRPIVRTVSGSSFSYTTSFDYRDSRHEVVETDGRGFQRTTELDGFDRVHRVVLQTGEAELVTTNFYDANGNLSSTKDPEGRETVFVYDGLNRLLEIQHPLSLTTRFLYDGEGNKTEETKRRGVPTRFTYDHLSRLTESATAPQITGNPVTTTIQYDDAARTRTELDARGNATTFVMDGQGRVVKITDADNNAQSFEYDGVNKLAEVDKRGQRTSFEYDGINRLVTMTDALSQKIETAYRDAALQIVETDKRGLVRRTQLDALGRLVSVTRSNVTLEQHAYDPNNNRILSTDANGNQTQFTYDGANRLTARTDGFGSADATTTRFTYDGVGNLLEEKDGRAIGKAFDIHNTYDALNRLTSVQDGAGQVTSFEYDGEGNRTAQTEPKGNRTEFSYGELSELIEVRMADSGVYRYTYDPNRNRTQQTDANGNVVAFTYDKLNRMERMEQQGAGPLVTLHTYDPNGNEITLTDPKGQVIGFEYDELNRLTNKTYHLTADDFALFTRTHSIGFSYDPNDNLVRIDELKSTGTDPAAVVSSFKTYDTLDRLTSETDAFGRTLGFAYDSQGNRTRLVDPDAKQTTYRYDALNRLQTLTFDDGTSTSYEYFPDGLKRRVANPNNTNSTYEYDGADRMTDIVHLGPVGVVSSYFYAYDANGNRKRQIETNAGRTEETTYDYDTANRLAMVTYALGTAEATQVTYTYDPVGNRLSEREIQLSTSTATKDLAYAYDTINRLDTITDNLGSGADVAYTYDSNGNTTSKTKNGTTTSFLFDIRDQLSEVQQGTNVLGRYGYDSEGLRILKIGDDGIRRYTYDQLSVITEANESNVTVSKYDYGSEQLVSLDNTIEGRSLYHLDALGSTVSLTSPSGAVRESVLYDAWGEARLRDGSSANKFTFIGLELDQETGLIYAKARFYDSDIGRFLSQDPLLGRHNFAPSLNRYAYAFSNPVVFVDRDGLQATRPGRIEGNEGEVAIFTEEIVVKSGSDTCRGPDCSQRPSGKEDTGVVEELKWGDPGFTEGYMQGIGEIFGGREPPTPEWEKSWARNFAESFADDAALTIATPALRVQYGILTDDAEQIAIGVGEQIAAAVVSRGLVAGGERVAAAAIARYPWLAKPITEAFRDASRGLKGAVQRQAQRVATKLEEFAARRSGRLGSPGSANTGSSVNGGGGTSATSGNVAQTSPIQANTTAGASQASVPTTSSLKPARPANLGNAPPHGGPAHAARIQNVVDRMRQQGWRDIRVNQSQVNSNLEVVGRNRPDISGINPRTGQRVNIEFDTNPAASVRHQATVVANDLNAVNVFVVIDSTSGRSLAS